MSIFIYLIYLPTLRNVETMLPSLTHYVHTDYPQLKSYLLYLVFFVDLI